MKKFIFALLIVIAFPILAQAQNVKHPKFLGLPLYSTVANFEAQLTRKGFTRHPQNAALLLGKYLGENVMVQIMSKNNRVSTVNVYSQDGYYSQTADEKVLELKAKLEKEYSGASFFVKNEGYRADIDGGTIGVTKYYAANISMYLTAISIIDNYSYGK